MNSKLTTLIAIVLILLTGVAAVLIIGGGKSSSNSDSEKSDTASNSSSSNSNTSNSDSCIITVFGQQYNVAPLRNKHEGGDIFVCGTDMTDEFRSQHGSSVSRLQEYKLN